MKDGGHAFQSQRTSEAKIWGRDNFISYDSFSLFILKHGETLAPPNPKKAAAHNLQITSPQHHQEQSNSIQTNIITTGNSEKYML